MKKCIIQLALIMISSIPTVTFAQEIVQKTLLDTRLKPNVAPETSEYIIQVNSIVAEDFENEVSRLMQEKHRKHPFGKEISVLLYIVEEKYTYYSEPAPGEFTGRKIVQKPLIYNSVMKLEKHYRREFRKNRISTEEAHSELRKILKKTILLYEADTRAFEELLKRRDSTGEIIHLFHNAQIQVS